MQLSEGLKGGLVGGLASTVLTASLFLGVMATADGNPQNSQVPELIPYSGRLEVNGATETLTGTDAPWLRFELTDGAGGDVVFQQDSQVEIYAGQFSVVLGDDNQSTDFVQSGTLTKAVTDADDLYLQITLLGDHNAGTPDVDTGNDNVAMTNPQRLLRSPFAFWATNSASFDVAADLEVGTTITSHGKITASSGGIEATQNDIVAAQGDITATLGNIIATDGNVTAGNNLKVGNKIVDNTDDTVNIGENLSVEGNLSIYTALSSSLGTTVEVDDDLEVQGDLNVEDKIYDSNGSTVTVGEALSVEGNVTAQGNLNVQSKIYDSNDNTVVVGENFQVEDNTTLSGTTHFGGNQTIASSANPACITVYQTSGRKGDDTCTALNSGYTCRTTMNGLGSPSSIYCPAPAPFELTVLCCRE